MIDKESISNWFKGLQAEICQSLEASDGTGKFISDAWERAGGGGGLTRVMNGGSVIEKGGVNFSTVWGHTPIAVLQSLQLPTDQQSDFFATGVSIVMHPYNPHVPIIHMNVRYFEMSNGRWWFGGGIDLTPHYVVDEDAVKFHQKLKEVCDKHHVDYYPLFKKWADDYFYLKHRNETRGVGGIFFDYLKADDEFNQESRFDFVKDVGQSFVPLYSSLMTKYADAPYSDEHKKWQHIRRGRYVEFNLVWDRGTKFGLDTDGRTESILMSMPPQAQWEYMYQPNIESPEGQTISKLKKGVDWANGI
ncbi:MAG: oxygen-dependent coproporphyrinogen oxidase [Chryseolinea sp.]